MAVSPTPLINTFKNNRDAPRTQPVDIAKQITDWYHKEVFAKNTENQYNNPPLSVNKGAFYSALAPAYVDVESSMKSANPSQLITIAGAHEAASLAYWSGALMQKTNPPPPAVAIQEHPVVNPGSFSVGLPEINSIEGYCGLLADAHTKHLLTVQGKAVSQMPDGSIQDFPWTGIG